MTLNQRVGVFLLWLALMGSLEARTLESLIATALPRYGLGPLEVGVWISPVDDSKNCFEFNGDALMQPASAIKLLTTAVALDRLGPAYEWKTRFYSRSGIDKAGRVRGFTIVGGGDPHLVVEHLWLIAKRLSGLGVKEIVGDIRVDRTFFSIRHEKQGLFDGRSARSYNVEPSAALVNFKSVSLEFIPDEAARVVRIVELPDLDQTLKTKKVKLTDEKCVDWKGKLKARISPESIWFEGGYPASCQTKFWHMSLWDENTYLKKIFTPILKSCGIRFSGQFVDAKKESTSRLLLEHKSEPLGKTIGYINKFSNNTMARELFLTLSVGKNRAGSLEGSRESVTAWLKEKGIWKGGTFVDNGSGLSRETRISARTLGEVVRVCLESPYGAEFVASLPIAGIDGTMKKRALKCGSAHIKTGRIDGVRSAAGVVKDQNGRDWIVSVIVNSKQSDRSEELIDRILNWTADSRNR